MKKLIVLVSICISVAVILCSASTVFAEEDVDVSVELNADFFSKYIWRGQLLNDDPVFQPGISVGYKNLNMFIWGNMDLTNFNRQDDEITEIDYTLEYSDNLPIKGFDWLNYSIGAIHYTLHGSEPPNTTELFWGLGLNCLLRPSVKVYHDIDEADGAAYLSFSVEHSFEKITEISGVPIGVDICSSFGWGSKSYNIYNWEVEHSSLNDFALSVSFPVEVDEWTFAPSINYVTLTDGKIRKSDAYSTESDYFFVGLSLSRRF